MRQYIKIVLIGTIFFIMGIGLGTFVVIMSTRPDFYALHKEINDLNQDYNDLLDDYNSLFSEYNSILSVLENPLTNPDTPTINQVFNWLATDDTDIYGYSQNWKCGDFSAMLMVRAKEMNWRMRISCMFYSFQGDDGWQNPYDPYGEYGHAFNVILCQDYDGDGTEDWFYIEPQTDATWYVYISGEYFVHYEIWYTFTGGIDGTVWQEPYYINHYSYFA